MSQDESYLKMYLNLWKTLLKRRSVLLIRYWLHVLCVYRKTQVFTMWFRFITFVCYEKRSKDMRKLFDFGNGIVFREDCIKYIEAMQSRS